MNGTIVIVPYNPEWPKAFWAERQRIKAAFDSLALRIDHVGSTSVPGLAAKPIIDIQVSVRRLQPIEAYSAPLQRLGYVHVPHPNDDAICPFFHTPAAWPHTHHVHVVESGGAEERRIRAFRDYLLEHKEAARQYEELKRRLAETFSAAGFSSQQEYAEAKTDFVSRLTEHAMAEGFPRSGSR
ncbi:MAG: GrpB family protein [Verrucomicrobia bacterium]|nr:GrpB family protein [Verrucomicrobiota bacterium]